MVNEQFIHLLPPPASKWAKAKKLALMVLYVLAAVVVSFLVIAMSESFTYFSATVLAFIFGPALWRRVN